MASIFQADIYCSGCSDHIKDRIARDLWENRMTAITPDGVNVREFYRYADLSNYLESMDERDYDSDEFPKWCSDATESDVPEHCAECKIFLGNALTTDGIEYVEKAIREDLLDGYDDSIAVTEWWPFYAFEVDPGLDQCADCGGWFDRDDLDDDELCEDCNG